MNAMSHFPKSQGPLRGLTEAEALARLKAEGSNELPQPDRRTPFRIAIEVLREPMLLLLLVGALPSWPYSQGWGYYPSGGLGLLLVIILVLLLMGRL